MVDGASRLTFFVRILLPLSRPALTTVAILAFVTSWNNYPLRLLFFTKESLAQRRIVAGLAGLAGSVKG